MMSEDDEMDELICQAMKQTFDKLPYDWQVSAIRRIVEMYPHGTPNNLSKTLLCIRSTGGGKSAVRDTAGCILRGVVLSMSPLLSLDAQQASNIDKEAIAGSGVVAIHLDSIKYCPDQLSRLHSFLRSLDQNTERTVFLFASPQAIADEYSEVRHSELRRLIDYVIINNLLRLLCLDEIQLFVGFGLHFRPETHKLKTCLLDRCSEIPKLLLTATASTKMLQHVHRLTGLHIGQNDAIWPGPEGVARRDVFFEVARSEKVVQLFCERALPVLQAGKKCILYTYSKDQSERYTKAIQEWMAINDIDGDVVLLNGNLDKDSKFHRTRKFVGPDEECDNPFRPRILVATYLCAGAGLDDPDVDFAMGAGIFSSKLYQNQLRGRVGRHANASPDKHVCCATISLKSYVCTIYMIHDEESDQNKAFQAESEQDKFPITLEEHQRLRLEDAHNTLKLFVLQPRCLNVDLESECQNPWSSCADMPACGVACSRCRDEGRPGDQKSCYFRPVSWPGAKLLIRDVFLSHNGCDKSLNEDLPKAIQEMEDASKLLFSSTRNVPQLQDVKGLILQLLATGMLKPKYDSSGKRVCAVLGVDSEGFLMIEKECYWAGISRK